MMIQRGTSNGKHKAEDKEDNPDNRLSMPTGSSERVAATLAGQEILDWLEEHTIRPIRLDLEKAQKRVDALLNQISNANDKLAEAYRLVNDLNSKIIAHEQRVIQYEAQIALLVRQLSPPVTQIPIKDGEVS